jgi:hypothetical protein
MKKLFVKIHDPQSNYKLSTEIEVFLVTHSSPDRTTVITSKAEADKLEGRINATLKRSAFTTNMHVTIPLDRYHITVYSR